MKKLVKSIILFFAATSGMYVSAQRPSHELSAYAATGLSTLRYKPDIGSKGGGFGGDFGVGYTYFMYREWVASSGTVYNLKWGVHSGVGMGLFNSKANVNKQETVTYGLVDSENDKFDLHTTLNNYSEKQNSMFLNIPIMATCQLNQYYAMAGFKLGVPLSAKHKAKDVKISNRAYYTDYDNWLEEQDFAGFGSFVRDEAKGKLDLGLSVAFSLEGGMIWRLSKTMNLYTGLYADIGLNNVAKSNANIDFVNFDVKDPKNLTTNSVMLSQSDKTNLIAVGVKARLGFSLK